METRADETTHGDPAAGASGARFLSGMGWGAAATLAMSVPMVAGAAAGILPMPKPIPAALVGAVFGSALAPPLHMALAAVSHFAYGAVAGGVLATISERVTVAKGLGWGILLWVLMGVAWLPFLGWGLFGTGISPRVTVATLVLHAIYGVTLGWGLDRKG